MKFKASSLAHPNIALIKYWGRNPNHPSYLNIPTNDSISMTKQSIDTNTTGIQLLTHTTIEFSEEFNEDTSFLKDEDVLIPFNQIQMERIYKVVNPLKELAGIDLNFKMDPENKFPTPAGLE